MRKFFDKHKKLLSSLIFLVVLAIVLGALSYISVLLDVDSNPLFNYSARSIFKEPDDSIDVIAIGTSDVYSAVSPLEWWNSYGYTGYAWGEPAQRIYETHEYLKKIYKHQSPDVVFIEVGSLFRDKSDSQNLDFMLKAQLANIFPLITYHRNLAPGKFKNFGADPHSVTKGYLIRDGAEGIDDASSYMKPNDKSAPINAFCKNELKSCIDLCEKNGSQVVLLSVPSFSSWNMKKHNAIKNLSDEYDVTYLDLNMELKNEIDWKKDTADAGTHLNYAGAVKVSSFLGEYLYDNYGLTDHRGDASYDVWNEDYAKYCEAPK